MAVLNGKELEIFLGDMLADKHEGIPHGVPLDYDWAQKPRFGDGPKDNYPKYTAWGQVYEDAEGNPADNTRVQIRNMVSYYFSRKEQKWIKLQGEGKIEGAAYPESFGKGLGTCPHIARDESENGGGASVTAGKGYNFHFWPSEARIDVVPSDIEAIYTTLEARLILDDEKGEDDRDTARYLMSVGGDFWIVDGNGSGGDNHNFDFAVGRFRYITNEWQRFSGWRTDDKTGDLFIKNPPPVD